LSAGDIPAMIVIRLGNDHTAGPRPGDGYPLLESYVADNDLALGQIIDVLSHSAIWKDTAVFVTEDDPQSGVDHVDAHRSVLLVMSPYVRSSFLSHRHSSMESIQRTIYELLGIGSLNLEDALASDLGDMFTTEPNVAPLGLFCVLYRLSLWFSGTNGPKLDLNKKIIEPDAHPGSGTYRVPDLYEFADTIDA
jgi:hypothetical protein